jgi:hypothetical protein
MPMLILAVARDGAPRLEELGALRDPGRFSSARARSRSSRTSSPTRSEVMRVSRTGSSSSSANWIPAPANEWRDEQHQLVDIALAQKGRGQRRAPLRAAATARLLRRARRARPRAGRCETSRSEGPLPKTSRRGWRTAPTSRAVSCGSSARTVPIPTATASTCARSSWTRLREAGPEIHRLLPGTVTRPSRVCANFNTTNGRRRETHVRHASF